jgi:hypothetical protein
MKHALRVVLVALALGTLAPRAHAQVIAEPPPPPFPDPKKFARGLFASGELGTIVYLGRLGHHADPGVAFGVRVGYDLLRWLALQLHAAGASSDANLPPPTVGQSFQLYTYAAEARLSLQLRRFALFAEGGGAVAQVSTNVLDQVGVTNGKRFSFAVVAGGGLDYHTLNRHFSVGLGADFLWLANFTNAQGLALDAYLRYTR